MNVNDCCPKSDLNCDCCIAKALWWVNSKVHRLLIGCYLQISNVCPGSQLTQFLDIFQELQSAKTRECSQFSCINCDNRKLNFIWWHSLWQKLLKFLDFQLCCKNSPILFRMLIVFVLILQHSLGASVRVRHFISSF